MNTVVASILPLLICVVLFSPRRWAWLGMSAGILFVTQGSYVELIGLRLYPLRFLELAGFARIIARREFSFSKLNGIDCALVALYSYTTIVFLLRSTEGQAYQIGLAVDAILCYFVFRGLIGDIEDFQWFLVAFVLLLAPYLALSSIERLTGNNPFAFMGGVIEGALSRGERPRCWGTFRHPILLGSFGASFLPLYIALVLSGARRLRSLIGVCLCLGIVWLSNSGGPLWGGMMAVIGWLCWKIRYQMAQVRRSIVGILALFALVMNAPVWFILARASGLTGGSGDHRSYVIDLAAKHLGSWWLAGVSLKETSDWFPITIDTTGGMDITNQYIAFGLAAGLGAMILFVYLLVKAFSTLGETLAIIRFYSSKDKGAELVIWGLGVTLSIHVVNWLGVVYFDQMYAVWFMHLAAISSLSESMGKSSYSETTGPK